MSGREWPLWTAAACAAAGLAPVQLVVAADYLSVEQAQRAVFPQADYFEEVVVALSAAQQQAVLEAAGPQPPHRSLRVWRAMHGAETVGHVFVDEVIGRQDFITYAVGIDTAGQCTQVEVLSYRESHGGEIRGTGWRRQFTGKRGLVQLRFQADIQNIAGATLSSGHVTQGVRWLHAMWALLLKPAAP